MRLFRASLFALLAFVIVQPLWSAQDAETPKPAPKDEPAEKPVQPFFKLDTTFPRNDSPQSWSGFQTQGFTPLAPFLGQQSFPGPGATPPSIPYLYNPNPYEESQ